MSNWDALLDRAMENHFVQLDLREERIEAALSTEEHDPCKWFNVWEAIANSSFTKEQEAKFEALLRAKDVKALDMIIELSTNYQRFFIEKDIDNE
jgi:hypothetical protein